MTHDAFGYVVSKRGLFIALSFVGTALMAQAASAETIFRESFDDLEDWTSTMHSTEKVQTVENGSVIPEGWWGIYQDTTWSPQKGYPDNHASLEILSKNSNKALGDSGKSAVFWRESYSLGWRNWASDAQFIKLFDQEYSELYVEFYIRFSENWWHRNRDNEGPWASKLFRIGHWSREGSIWNSQTGDVNPRMFWDYKKDNYGVRNVLALWDGPPGQSEKMPRSGSKNYTSHTVGHEEEGQPSGLTSALDPDQSLTNLSGPASHEQVFGKPDNWTKVAFYVKMNSAPGVSDGILRQWINGQRIINYEDLEWVKDYSGSGAENVGWNFVAIGGNDYFQPYPNEERFEDWYAIDDLVIATEPPESMASSADNAPNPPSNILVSD